MASKHTPGPWRAVFDMDERGAEVETFSRGFAEGSVGICNCNVEDARIIAAAPEMYRLLRYLLDHSNAKALLSDGYVEDLQAVLATVDGGSEHE